MATATIQHTCLHENARYFCPVINKCGFSRRILIEVPSTKFHEYPSIGSRAATCGQTDTHVDVHDEGNKRFS
jgi:hypothetical protein